MPIRRGKAERHYWKRKVKHRPRDVQEDIWEGIYAEPLIGIETFVASPEFLNADPLFPRQAGVLTEFFDPLKAYTELVLKWGKGSGKDYVAACAIAYMVYQALRLPNPQRYYGLASGDPIDFVNVAYNARQARDVFFKRFKAPPDNKKRS